jgi:hypothetical protein
MIPALQLRSIILPRESIQGAVLEIRNGTALVSTSRGTRRMPMDVAAVPGDLVTVSGDRIVSKRTGGVGGAIKVYFV